MRYIDYLKLTDNFDKYLLFLDNLGFSDTEIATLCEVTTPTIHNAKKRQEPIIEALKTITAEAPTDKRNPDVQMVCQAFMTAFDTTKISKWDRFAAKRLADKHGADNIVKVITVLALNASDKYAPSVNSVRQLEEKWVNVSNYFKKKAGDTAEIDL
jgi:hypothetical protein